MGWRFLRITCNCSECSRGLTPEEVKTGALGEPLCFNCYEHFYDLCFCGKTTLKKDLYDGLCNDCFNDVYFSCADCGEVESIDDVIDICNISKGKIESYCKYCAPPHTYKKCVVCGDSYFLEEMDEGQALCLNCKQNMSA